MSVIASPITLHYSVSDADDPYKKYWWAILLGFALTTLWLLSPMLGEKSIGSTQVDLGGSKNDAGVEQSLASSESDGGIAVGLDGMAKTKKEEGAAVSGLYQPAPEAAPVAATAPLGSASGRTLADELKKVGESGWGEKAQRGFSAPRLSGGSMSGMGAASGGRAGSAGSAPGVGAFGARNSQVGFAATKNISDAPELGAAGVKGMAGLKSAAVSARLAAGSSSGDAAANSLGRIFDGTKAQNQIGGPGGAALNGAYEALDTAPVNLKLNDPKLDEKKLTPPPATKAPVSDKMDDAEFAKELALTMAGSLIGGAIGGPAGAAVAQVATQAIQRQMDQQRKVRELEQKQGMDSAGTRMSSTLGR